MINSNQNQLYKRLKALKNKKNRDTENVFVAEGLRFVKDIPESLVVELYAVSETFADTNDLSLFEKRSRVFVFTDKLFQDLCETQTPQGILAICAQQNFEISECLEGLGENDFVVVCESLNDPGNLGTIIRTADALGAKAVVLTSGCVDIYNSKVLRSTMGSVFHLPIIKNIETPILLDELKKHNVNIYATALDGSVNIFEANLCEKCAIFIGNEARGISDLVISDANLLINIPMYGKAESFNASIAAGIVMYEASRQRQKK